MKLGGCIQRDGLIFRITRNITQVVAEHRKRLAGKGNYNIVRSVRVWLMLATSFSIFPLRIASFLEHVFLLS
jgi:undecaprenyl-phosphate 4-deoxy-4-formamido-L-arabinose transferase